MYAVDPPAVGTHCEKVYLVLQPKAPGVQGPNRGTVALLPGGRIGAVSLYDWVRAGEVRWISGLEERGGWVRLWGLACAEARRKTAAKEMAGFILRIGGCLR